MQRTGTLLVEDRDTAFLFLNPEGIEDAADGVAVTVEVTDGVADWEREGPEDDSAVWLSNQEGDKLRVVRRDTLWSGDKLLVDWDKDDFLPIPTPVVIADKAAWKAWNDENA